MKGDDLIQFFTQCQSLAAINIKMNDEHQENMQLHARIVWIVKLRNIFYERANKFIKVGKRFLICNHDVQFFPVLHGESLISGPKI